MTTVIETLADYVVAEGQRMLPAAVLHHAKRALIDLAAKFLELATPPLGDDAAHDLLAMLNDAETLGETAIATLGSRAGF